jgi:hypothetical protein
LAEKLRLFLGASGKQKTDAENQGRAKKLHGNGDRGRRNHTRFPIRWQSISPTEGKYLNDEALEMKLGASRLALFGLGKAFALSVEASREVPLA